MKSDISISTFALQSGQWHVSTNHCIIQCHGLGSCVGLFLMDTSSGVWGGIHIMLPSRGTSSSTLALACYADKGIDMVVNVMERNGASKSKIRAKLVGGSNIYSQTHYSIGQDNAQATISTLDRHNILIDSQDLGGKIGRSAKFNSQSGRLIIQTPFEKYII